MSVSDFALWKPLKSFHRGSTSREIVLPSSNLFCIQGRRQGNGTSGRRGASSVIFSKEGSGRGRDNETSKNERLGLCLVESSQVFSSSRRESSSARSSLVSLDCRKGQEKSRYSVHSRHELGELETVISYSCRLPELVCNSSL